MGQNMLNKTEVQGRAKVISVISSRPEIIQAAPVSAALRGHVNEILVHTGQHYDDAMSDGQILATRLPRPDFNLGVGSLPLAEQVALGQERLAALIEAELPDAVIVRGDTSGTLSGARAATDAGVMLIHIEAGLRSGRMDMPEEYNRIETDRLSDVLLAPIEGARRNLLSEGVRGEIHVTGDPLCDILESWRDRVVPSDGEYVLATVHRNYNTDDQTRLRQVLECLSRSPWTVVFPVHPRTRARIAEWQIRVPANVELIDPVPYTRMLELERGAQAIATDSGGVQREAYLWGVRCVTLREETEWVDTVEAGWNSIVGVDPDAFEQALDRPLPKARPTIFGDGNAATRIAHIVAESVGEAMEVAA
jgi:UDP-N-acetylglucosamine 2-epimerase (non-hydrolysing)